MNCGFFNANGITNRKDDIERFMITKKIDIMYIVETHLTRPWNKNPNKRIFSEIQAHKGLHGGIIGGMIGFCNSEIPIKEIRSTKYWTITKIMELFLYTFRHQSTILKKKC